MLAIRRLAALVHGSGEPSFDGVTSGGGFNHDMAVASLAGRWAGLWSRTDLIFDILADTAAPDAGPGSGRGFYARPISQRHPFIFYVGHLVRVCACVPKCVQST